MCNCRAGQQPDQWTEVRVDDLETKRLETARKLFELADLNGDGLLSVDEFSEMGLNQTKVHAEKQLTPGDEQLIKDEFVQKYQRELDSSLRPVTCDEYQEYILRFANRIDPGDFKAGSWQFFCHLSQPCLVVKANNNNIFLGKDLGSCLSFLCTNNPILEVTRFWIFLSAHSFQPSGRTTDSNHTPGLMRSSWIGLVVFLHPIARHSQ